MVVDHLDLVARHLSTLVVEGREQACGAVRAIDAVVAVERELHVLRSHVGPVLEDDVLFERARIRLRVVEIAGLGKVHDRLVAAGRDRQQPRNDVVDHVPRRQVIRARRVVRHGLVRRPVDDRPGFASAASVVVAPSTAGNRQREGGQHGARQRQLAAFSLGSPFRSASLRTRKYCRIPAQPSIETPASDSMPSGLGTNPRTDRRRPTGWRVVTNGTPGSSRMTVRLARR